MQIIGMHVAQVIVLLLLPMLTEITRKLDSGRCAVRLKKASKVTEISIH